MNRPSTATRRDRIIAISNVGNGHDRSTVQTKTTTAPRHDSTTHNIPPVGRAALPTPTSPDDHQTNECRGRRPRRPTALIEGGKARRTDTLVAIAPFDTRPSQSANPVAGLPFTPSNRVGERLKNMSIRIENCHRSRLKYTCTHRQKRIATNPSIWNRKSRFLHGFGSKTHLVALLKTFLKKPEKRC